MPPAQSSGNQYDFIMTPGKTPKKSVLPSLGGGSSFTRKIIFIIAGGLLLIVVFWIVGTLLGGGGNTANLTKLVQQEEEITRIATEGATASRADIRSTAANIQLSLNSQQQEWLQFLADQGSKISEDQQKLMQNTATDEQLTAARSNNTFDKTFLTLMRSYLTDYSSTLQTAFASASDETERALLSAHFDQTQLLLKQLPES